MFDCVSPTDVRQDDWSTCLAIAEDDHSNVPVQLSIRVRIHQAPAAEAAVNADYIFVCFSQPYVSWDPGTAETVSEKVALAAVCPSVAAVPSCREQITMSFTLSEVTLDDEI